MKPDGSDIKRLTKDSYSYFEASWSPDLSLIAASGMPPLQGPQRLEWFEIYILDSLGTFLDRLTWNGRNPIWSPDGKQIAFERQGPIGNYAGIYIIDADGTNERKINIDPYTIIHIWDWSKDGEKVLTMVEEYVEGSSRAESYELYEMDLNGNLVQQITNTRDLREYDARWSPDDTKITFSTIGLYRDIYIINSDGTDSYTILPPGQKKIGGFRWSPDGSRIAFEWYGESGRFEKYREWTNVHVISTDGTELTQITFDDSTDIVNVVADWR